MAESVKISAASFALGIYFVLPRAANDWGGKEN